MADVNVLDLSEVTPGSGDSLILFDRATGVATSTRFDTLKSAVTSDVAATVAQHTSDIQTLTNNVSYISQKVSNSSDEYDSTKAYLVGDLAIHDNVLYRCITACSAAAWSVNQSCFVEDSIANIINERTVAKRVNYIIDTNGRFVTVYQIGRLVLVNFSGFTFTLADYPNGILMTGLPQPQTGVMYNPLFDAYGTEYRGVMDTAGALSVRTRAGATLGANVNYISGSFSYISK